MITLVAAWLGLQAALAQPQLVDCQCLFSHAQGILRTNACQAVVPDLCQFKECFTSTAVPPPAFTCSQTPAAGTVVGPGSYSITVTVSANGQASSCTLPFQVDPPTTGCNGLTLTCSSNKTVECSSTWTFDPPTATGGCPNSQGLPPNVTIVVVSTTTNGTCPKVITRT